MRVQKLVTCNHGSGLGLLGLFRCIIPRDALVSDNLLCLLFEVHVADVSLGVSEVGAHQTIVPVEVPPWRQNIDIISTATI